MAKRPTAFRIGALVLNVAIVLWLAYRKRLFVRILYGPEPAGSEAGLRA